MYDALEELTSLSEQLQSRSCSLIRADKIMRRCIRALESMMHRPGEKTTEAMEAVAKIKFTNIDLICNQKCRIVNHNQFLQSLIDNMKSRLFTTQSSSVSTICNKPQKLHEETYKILLQDLNVLNPESWPAEIPQCFGEEVRCLCQKFGLVARKAIDGIREFVDNGGRRIPDDLMFLTKCVATIPCSTAECEPGLVR